MLLGPSFARPQREREHFTVWEVVSRLGIPMPVVRRSDQYVGRLAATFAVACVGAQRSQNASLYRLGYRNERGTARCGARLLMLQRYGASAAHARSSDMAPQSWTPAPAAPIPANRL
jgi:hypothetical protein